MRFTQALLATAGLVVFSQTPAQAGVLDKAKAAKETMDKAANQPVKVAVGKGNLMDNRDDLLKVVAAYKKKIGTDPLMVYGMRITFSNQMSLVYQSRFDKEKLEMLGFANGQIDGKPGSFKLIGKEPKVADNIFDLGQVKLAAIPDLVKMAREKTSQATKAKKTLGANVDVVKSFEPGSPARIVISVAADDKSTLGNIGDSLTLKDEKTAKGSSVGVLTADASGKVLDFRTK